MSVSTASKTDSDIQDRVEKELEWSPQVRDAANIGVAVHEGVVSLSGAVSSYAEKVAAAKAALRMRGVSAVANDIVVRYAGSKRTDAQIAEAARDVLAMNVSVPKGAVEIEVRNGVVILSGEVEWDYQRRTAKRAVQDLRDVEGVFNQITLKHRAGVNAGETDAMVRRAILRNASTDARSITVKADGTKVILRGSVASYAERKQAELAAWSSPHVTEVDNEITIHAS
jgi:osmotically-inducible protein OsmY